MRWERLASVRCSGPALPPLPSAAALAISSAYSFPSTPLCAGVHHMVKVLSRLVRLSTVALIALVKAWAGPVLSCWIRAMAAWESKKTVYLCPLSPLSLRSSAPFSNLDPSVHTVPPRSGHSFAVLWASSFLSTYTSALNILNSSQTWAFAVSLRPSPHLSLILAVRPLRFSKSPGLRLLWVVLAGEGQTWPVGDQGAFAMVMASVVKAAAMGFAP